MSPLPILSKTTLLHAWRDLSLGTKILFLGLGTLFLVAGAVMVITYLSAEASLRSQMQRQVSNELKVFERLYTDRQNAQRASDEMVAMMGGVAAVFDGSRSIAAAGLEPGTTLPALMRREGFFDLEHSGTVYLAAVQPLNDASRTVFVRGVPKRQIAEMLQRHAWGIFSFSGTAMLLAFMALLWLSRTLVRPLHQLHRASRTLLSDEAPMSLAFPETRDELGRLGTDFRQLSERLLETKAALEEKDRLRTQLLEKLITAQEDERKRISRELHDETGQALTSLLVGLKVLERSGSPAELRERIEALQALTHATLEEVHKLSVELRPAVLDDLGLVVALKAYAKDFSSHHRVKADVQVDAPMRFSPLVEVAVYRVVQEALTNVAKYARATSVELRVRRSEGWLHVEIRDDGIGFDTDRVLVARQRENRLGVLGMQERITLLGGRFSLESEPGEGTRVAFALPLGLCLQEEVTNV